MHILEYLSEGKVQWRMNWKSGRVLYFLFPLSTKKTEIQSNENEAEPLF